MAFLLPLAGVLGGAALGGLLGGGGGGDTSETKEVQSDCSWIERSYVQYEEQYRDLEAKLRECDANSPEVERQLRELDEKVRKETDDVKDEKMSSNHERQAVEAEMAALKDQLERESAQLKEQLRTKKERWELQLSQKETEDANVINQLQQQLGTNRDANDVREEEVKHVLEQQQVEHMQVMALRKQEFVSQVEKVDSKVLVEDRTVTEAPVLVERQVVDERHVRDENRKKREVGSFGSEGKAGNFEELSGKDLFAMINEQRNVIQNQGILCAYQVNQQVFPVNNLELLCNTFSQLS